MLPITGQIIYEETRKDLPRPVCELGTPLFTSGSFK